MSTSERWRPPGNEATCCDLTPWIPSCQKTGTPMPEPGAEWTTCGRGRLPASHSPHRRGYRQWPPLESNGQDGRQDLCTSPLLSDAPRDSRSQGPDDGLQTQARRCLTAQGSGGTAVAWKGYRIETHPREPGRADVLTCRKPHNQV